MRPLAAPFPWFGGKRNAARAVWAALGDPGNYVEPFCGSAAVLLARPASSGRRIETLNDRDGWLVNAWRAIRDRPAEVAAYCSGPLTEIDYHARLAWLQERRGTDLVSWLEGDPDVSDPKAAGWWLYVCAAGIGWPFDAGPWRVVDGRLVKTGDAGRGIRRELPHLGDAGRGVRDYLCQLARRLESVRITCGDWSRVLTPSVLRAGNTTGIFLDPPYSIGDQSMYDGDQDGVAHAVREWCRDADEGLRIVLCGYGGEHDALLPLGWRKALGRSGNGNGYNTRAGSGKRERLWFSPACLDNTPTLFNLVDDP